MTSNVVPGSVHCPPMKWPNTRSCLPNQESASLALSGAGPYSSDSKISATDDISLGHGHTVTRGVAPGHEMLELAFDIGEQCARSDAEEIGTKPPVSQLLLHEEHVLEDVLRGADATGRLEADGVACLLVELTNHAGHNEGEGERCVHALLARGRLD